MNPEDVVGDGYEIGGECEGDVGSGSNLCVPTLHD